MQEVLSTYGDAIAGSIAVILIMSIVGYIFLVGDGLGTIHGLISFLTARFL